MRKITINRLTLITTLSVLLTVAAFLPSTAYARIAVRQGAQGGEFYDTATGAKFIPRGNNYIKLGSYLDPFNICVSSHATFNVPISNGCNTYSYSSSDAIKQLTKMQSDGYNVVRVIINQRLIAKKEGGLDPAYIANVADFLLRAKNHHIYVMLTVTNIPVLGGYNPTDHPEWFDMDSRRYLSETGVQGKQKYLTDFVNGLKAANAPMDAIFAYSIENETYFIKSGVPLSLTSGLVKTANGKQYNMASAFSKNQMIDAGEVFYVNTLRDTIQSLDPGSLVTIGFFSPFTGAAVNNNWLVRTKSVIDDPSSGGSKADFIDIHEYVGPNGLASQIASLQITTNKKPLLMGEFGATISKSIPVAQAAQSLMNWQIQSCPTFSGWLLWTWDTNTTVWNAANNPAIDNALRPISRPDPCSSKIAAPALKVGDLNSDGKIDASDFTIFKNDFGKTGTAGFVPSDLNRDGKVDIFDYGIFVGNFGK